MKTTYKNIPLLKKGYPTPFWIASSNSHISRHEPKQAINFKLDIGPPDAIIQSNQMNYRHMRDLDRHKLKPGWMK